jgi:hypothetical protein
MDDDPYQICAFNFKKHSAMTESVIKLPHYEYENGRHRETFEFARKDIPLHDIERNSDMLLIKKPSPEGLEIFKVLHTDEFYTFPDRRLKEQLYHAHLVSNGNSDSSPYKLTFATRPDGNLLIRSEKYISSYSVRLNPFSDHDLSLMREAAKTGIVYADETDKKKTTAFLKNYLPEVYAVISRKYQPPLTVAVISPNENTAENFRQNIVKLKKSGLFPNNPPLAASALLKDMNEQHRQSVNVMLRSLGCNSPESTKKIINSWFAADNRDCDKKLYAEINR